MSFYKVKCKDWQANIMNFEAIEVSGNFIVTFISGSEHMYISKTVAYTIAVFKAVSWKRRILVGCFFTHSLMREI